MVLMGMKRVNQSHVYRILQFLAAEIRPLYIAERAALTFDFERTSQYHNSLLDAHIILAQASLAVLLRDTDVNSHADSAVLAGMLLIIGRLMHNILRLLSDHGTDLDAEESDERPVVGERTSRSYAVAF